MRYIGSCLLQMPLKIRQDFQMLSPCRNYYSIILFPHTEHVRAAMTFRQYYPPASHSTLFFALSQQVEIDSRIMTLSYTCGPGLLQNSVTAPFSDGDTVTLAVITEATRKATDFIRG